ncbi:MAG: hypothetical protein QM619_15910 [Micropruina sp.]|uniref:hypothetical protein n=1 Tax=Micropruina sp. TaxID=2737536 RepID=UPI0039E2D2B7
MSAVEALPPTVRLFHIGPQKTGTTALQTAAAAQRPQLMAHGVLYPGRAVNHRLAVASLVGKTIGLKAASDGTPTQPPPRRYWNDLVAEVNRYPDRRAWFGHEYAAGATTSVIREVHDTFGDDLHILITLRSVARMLPSIWQETNKAAGNRGTFDRWLRHAFTPGAKVNVIVQTRHDQGALVRRWADVVGRENVTVVVLNPRDHDFLPHTVEQLLGLPVGLLAMAEREEHAVNRSLTAPEVELFRQFNRRFRGYDTTPREHELVMIRGMVPRVLGYREPPSGEPRLAMPDWAADLADDAALRNADAVAASGVRVIGDLDHLRLPAHRRREPGEDHRSVTCVPVDLAVEAMLGVAAVALGRDAGFARSPERPMSLASVPVKELAAELSRRGAGRVVRLVRRRFGRVKS